MNETQENSGLGISRIEKRGDLAATAMASKAKALVEARFTVAMHRPRNIMQARSDILDACRRPRFAEAALYAKPVAGKKMIGPSIRFAETAIQCMRNIVVDTTTVHEDDESRTINIAVTDLENNLSYGKDVTIAKTVERRKLKDGQQPISKRLNTYGEVVFLVAATDDEIQNKIAAQESKVIRNCGLRLIPQDIIEEATEVINETRAKGAKAEDPSQRLKKVVDAFQNLNVPVTEIERYLEHPLAQSSPKEIEELRDIYTTIKDGEATWASYFKVVPEPPAAQPKPQFAAAKQPDPDNQIPGAEVKPDPKPDPKPSPQSQIAAWMDSVGVEFSDFVSWLKTTAIMPDADNVPSVNDLPPDICAGLLKSPAQLEKCAKIFGHVKEVAK
jgi:hypothetical protein